MNNERMDYLLAYMGGLTKLANSEVSYRCNNEIAECVGWIREELQKAPKDPFADCNSDISINVMKAENRELVASIVLDGDDAIVHKDYLVEVNRND